jgi:hypothetical protein
MSHELITHLLAANKVFGKAGTSFKPVATDVRRLHIFDARYLICAMDMDYG